MLKRIQFYNDLKGYVASLESVYDTAVENNNAQEIRNALQAIVNCFPQTIKDTIAMKVELHNELARRLYLRAHKRVLAVTATRDYNILDVQNLLNDRLKIVAICNDHATIIMNYSTAQIKYHDSLMRMIRKEEHLQDRAFLIDKELEYIK